jgi:RNA polymerase sigma-70 factor (ECF subfamily)
MSSYVQFENEFLSFREQLSSYLYRLTTDPADTEDLLQDTYLRARQKFSGYQGKSTLKTWVFTIATNLARDNYKVKKRWQLDAQDHCRILAESASEHQAHIFAAKASIPDQQFEITEHIDFCFTCVAKNLKLEEQIAIILAEVYQFKRGEIAAILNKTEGVVKHLLHNSRRALQQRYDNRCALVSKKGVCYQCAELDATLNQSGSAKEKVTRIGLAADADQSQILQQRFEIIRKIHPLNTKGAALEKTIMKILHEAIGH